MLVGELIGGIIEGVSGLAQLVAESLGFAAGRLGKEPKDGESRLTSKRLLVAFTPLLAVVLGIGGLFWLMDWRQEKEAAEFEQTSQLVRHWANKLAQERDANGRMIRHPNQQLDARDVWGQPLLVEYKRKAIEDEVTVRSKGRDGEDDTWDDIDSSVSVVLPKEVGRVIVNKVGEAIRRRRSRRENGAPGSE